MTALTRSVLLSASLATPALYAGPLFSLTDLGAPPGGALSLTGFSPTGAATGWVDASNGQRQAVLWQNGSWTTLTGGNAQAFSAAGDLIVGVSTPAGQAPQATAWQAGTVRTLGTLGGSGSTATAVNERGQVVGGAQTANGQNHAFLSNNGGLTDLGVLAGGTWSTAYGINQRGQVVGTADGAPGQFRAFLWTPEAGTRSLGTLGGRNSYATGINDAGAVIGVSQNTLGFLHAFLWEDGRTRDLGTLGGTTSYAHGINRNGSIAGSSSLADGATHAFLYANGILLDLNLLVPDRAGWTLTDAFAINDSGSILAMGSWLGQQRAVRLDPLSLTTLVTAAVTEVPEPGGVAVAAVGMGVVLGFRLWQAGRRERQQARE